MNNLSYISLCAGIDAASVETRRCAGCTAVKSLDDFYKHRTGPMGRHSYCKVCHGKRYKGRRRTDSPSIRRERNFKRRYGLTESQVAEKIAQQDNLCGMCGEQMAKPCVDHNHETGQIRGMLCLGCNLALGLIERPGMLQQATAYLARYSK